MKTTENEAKSLEVSEALTKVQEAKRKAEEAKAEAKKAAQEAREAAKEAKAAAQRAKAYSGRPVRLFTFKAVTPASEVIDIKDTFYYVEKSALDYMIAQREEENWTAKVEIWKVARDNDGDALLVETYRLDEGTCQIVIE